MTSTDTAIAATPPPLPEVVELEIGGMTCASCSSRVQRHLNKLEGAEAVVNLATEQARVRYDPALVTAADLVAVVERAGFTASLRSDAAAKTDDGALDAQRRRLIVALVLATPVIVISMVSALQFDYWQWLALALSAPVVWWAGAAFHAKAWQSLRLGEASMDTLISIGSLAAWGYSLVALLFLGAGTAGQHMRMSLTGSSGEHPVYFEVAAGVVALILLGRFLEARAKQRAGDAVRSLLSLQSRQARVIRDGVETMIDTDQLVVGDRFVVRAGEKIPTDGTVEAGNSTIDTSLVTGESVPVEVVPGAAVVGATMNLTGQLVATATSVGAETLLGQIARRVEQAQLGKAKIQRLADQVSAVFVPIVVLLAVATLGFWLGYDRGAGTAFSSAVAVLIVACPCAMGLATPVALMVGTGRGAQLGILIGGAEVLESTRAVDTVVFDKTGTLTEGAMSLVATHATPGVDEQEALARAGAVEAASNHPIARAIAEAARERGDLPAADDLAEHAGRGASGVIAGERVVVGSAAYLTGAGLELAVELAARIDAAAGAGRTPVCVGWGGTVRAVFEIADTPRAQSSATVAQLRRLGLRAVMLTGDNAKTAQAVAAQLGIAAADVIADVMPDGKADVVERLQRDGRVVAMVGDGINDAPALAQADLGISMGSGSDVAIQASDITLVGSDITKVAASIHLARRTLRTIQGNLFWAFAYNVAAIPLAATGRLNPLIAAAAMACSSLFVVMNSLRLRRFAPAKERVA